MEKLIDKIYLYDKKQCIYDILNIYSTQGYCIVNFLYFFNLLRILEKWNGWKKYYNVLLNSDFVLPDGIALRLYLKKSFGKNVYNLNGTDFIPYFFNFGDKLLENFGKQFKEDSQKYKSLSVFFYGTEKKVIERVYKKYKDKWNIVYYQDGFSEFDRDKLSSLNQIFKDSNLNILLVGLGTPKQEFWIQNNIDKIKKYGFIVFGVGGLFDFLGGEEKRAPKFIRELNLERLWRMIINPKKNFKKGLLSFKIFKYLLK